MSSQSGSEQQKSLAEANNQLALSLYRLLVKTDKNVFFSPFSVSTAMAMLFCGATHETAAELRRALGYDLAGLKEEDVKVGFQAMLESLEKNPDSYKLSCANAMVTQKNLDINDSYKALLEENFRALLQEADFHSETEAVLKRINDWVSSKTDEMIPELLSTLSPATVLVLLNAVFFKGFWVHKFDKEDTYLQPFHSTKGSKKVDMMHMKQSYLFVQKDTFKALQLPYKGGDIAMLVLLPHAVNGLNDLEKSLTASFIGDLKTSMYSQQVKTTFPKFRQEYSKSLVNPFKLLGVERAFDGPAQFNGMSESVGLVVSEIIHKAVVEVNEEGTKAAAATAILMMRCAMPVREPEFIADHPFLFCIYNVKTDFILFMGRVDEL